MPAVRQEGPAEAFRFQHPLVDLPRDWGQAGASRVLTTLPIGTNHQMRPSSWTGGRAGSSESSADGGERLRLIETCHGRGALCAPRWRQGENLGIMPTQVPEVGIEPTRGCPHASLSRARLPVPPLRPGIQVYGRMRLSSNPREGFLTTATLRASQGERKRVCDQVRAVPGGMELCGASAWMNRR